MTHERKSLLMLTAILLLLVAIVTGAIAYVTDTSRIQTTSIASTEAEDRPSVPDTAREIGTNTWYWETNGGGRKFVDMSTRAIVIQRDFYADNGWHYLHLVLEADGRRIAISRVKKIPFVDPDTSVGDKVKMSYIGNYIMFVGRVIPDEQ